MRLEMAMTPDPHHCDRLEYDLGPRPWEGQPCDGNEPDGEWMPATCWVALGPVPEVESAAMYDGPAWLWVRGLVIDHEARDERRRREEQVRIDAAAAAAAALDAEAARRGLVRLRPIIDGMVGVWPEGPAFLDDAAAAPTTERLRGLVEAFKCAELRPLLWVRGLAGGDKHTMVCRLVEWACREDE